jgi:V/A-type H+-transporting ATPase subunit D
MRDVIATKSTSLALAEERKLMLQGYEFLDEKRMLLASEILRQLAVYKASVTETETARRAAAAALATAIERHGLEELQLTAPLCEPRVPQWRRTLFLRAALLQIVEDDETAAAPAATQDASPELKSCRDKFSRFIRIAARAATIAANLRRLAAEYRRTERRAKTLENVLLPEIEETLKHVDEELEASDQEELVHTRSPRRSESER